MLILRRKKNERILIGDNIRITVIDCAADGVRLAIDAPKQVSILREELSAAEEENRQSVTENFNQIEDLQSNLLAVLGKKGTAALAETENTDADSASDSQKETDQ